VKSLRRPLVFCAAVIGTVFFIRDGCAYVQRQREAAWKNERLPELRRTIRDAAPIIAAIRKHEKDHGKPPEKLQELVPRYLSAVPRPGEIARSINWDYESENPLHGERWQLGVPVRRDFCPRCGYSFGDMFVYHPSGKYPRAAYGGILEKVDDWGYYHE
jgi:hypothetical protein